MTDMTTATSLAPCPLCQTPLCRTTGKARDYLWQHPMTGCALDGLRLHKSNHDQWNTRPNNSAAIEVVESLLQTAEAARSRLRRGMHEASYEAGIRCSVLNEVLDRLRALPQDTGFAAGVAACVGVVKETGLFCKAMQESNPRTFQHWRLREMECASIIKKLSNLSPQPEDKPDKGLREALLNLLTACQGVDGYEGLDEARQEAWKQLATQEKQG